MTWVTALVACAPVLHVEAGPVSRDDFPYAEWSNAVAHPRRVEPTPAHTVTLGEGVELFCNGEDGRMHALLTIARGTAPSTIPDRVECRTPGRSLPVRVRVTVDRSELGDAWLEELPPSASPRPPRFSFQEAREGSANGRLIVTRRDDGPTEVVAHVADVSPFPPVEVVSGFGTSVRCRPDGHGGADVVVTTHPNAVVPPRLWCPAGRRDLFLDVQFDGAVR